MKAFTIKGKTLLTVLFTALAAVLVTAVCVRNAQAAAVSAPKQELPIYSVQKKDKTVSITFDVAWDDAETKPLLDILDQYDVKATFFVVGAWVDKYPDSTKALADAGHEVCNHSDTHPHMPRLSQSEIENQITECNRKIEAVTGIRPILFRPPYGDYSSEVVRTAEKLQMYSIQWNVDSLDWKNPTPEQIKNRVLSGIKPGSIVLFHDGAKNTPAALPGILQTLKSQGYSIVPVSQLIYRSGYTMDSAGTQIPDSPSSSAVSSQLFPGESKAPKGK